MDGMLVQVTEIDVLSGDTEYTASGTIHLPSPTATIAEISVNAFAYLYGADMDAYGVFTGCVTDGSNAGLPAVESSLNGGAGQPVVIRSGLEYQF